VMTIRSEPVASIGFEGLSPRLPILFELRICYQLITKSFINNKILKQNGVQYYEKNR
jgi:hypothetical protein